MSDSEMSPGLTVSDVLDGGLVDLVLSPETTQGLSSLQGESDLQDLNFSQLGRAMGLPTALAPLGISVGHVVPRTTQKEVGVVADTGAIVAVVEDHLIARVLNVGRVGPAVGENCPGSSRTVERAVPEAPVAASDGLPGEDPAGAQFRSVGGYRAVLVDRGPETILDRECGRQVSAPGLPPALIVRSAQTSGHYRLRAAGLARAGVLCHTKTIVHRPLIPVDDLG